MITNNQYINFLLSSFFVVMIVFILFAKQMVERVAYKQQQKTIIVE